MDRQKAQKIERVTSQGIVKLSILHVYDHDIKFKSEPFAFSENYLEALTDMFIELANKGLSCEDKLSVYFTSDVDGYRFFLEEDLLITEQN